MPRVSLTDQEIHDLLIPRIKQDPALEIVQPDFFEAQLLSLAHYIKTNKIKSLVPIHLKIKFSFPHQIPRLKKNFDVTFSFNLVLYYEYKRSRGKYDPEHLAKVFWHSDCDLSRISAIEQTTGKEYFFSAKTAMPNTNYAADPPITEPAHSLGLFITHHLPEIEHSMPYFFRYQSLSNILSSGIEKRVNAALPNMK